MIRRLPAEKGHRWCDAKRFVDAHPVVPNGVERDHVDVSIFYDGRYQGICEAASAAAIRESKGIPEGANPFDYFGALELSMHEFQTNRAADVIGREGIKNEAHATRRNYEVGKLVRNTVLTAGGTNPKKIPIAEPIAVVKKRLAPPKAPSAAKAKPGRKPGGKGKGAG